MALLHLPPIKMIQNSIKHHQRYKEEKKRKKEKEKIQQKIEKIKEKNLEKLKKYQKTLEERKEKEYKEFQTKIKKIYENKFIKKSKQLNLSLEKKIRQIQGKKPLKKHEKQITTSALKKKLFVLVQLYARLRDSNAQGTGCCISCGKRVYYKKADGGHYISRKYMISAFNPDNINLQCKTCNQPSFRGGLDGNLLNYRKWLIKKIGLKKTEELENNKNQIKKWTIEELQNLIKYYQKEINKLKRKKEDN